MYVLHWASASVKDKTIKEVIFFKKRTLDSSLFEPQVIVPDQSKLLVLSIPGKEVGGFSDFYESARFNDGNCPTDICIWFGPTPGRGLQYIWTERCTPKMGLSISIQFEKKVMIGMILFLTKTAQYDVNIIGS